MLNYKIFLFLYTLNHEYVNGIVAFYSEIARILRFERTGKSFCHMSTYNYLANAPFQNMQGYISRVIFHPKQDSRETKYNVD